MKIRIAIIEDEFYTRKAIGQYVGKLGTPYEVCGEAGNGQEGLELLRRERPEIALVDITMPIVNGIDMIQIAANEGLPTQMIILTGYSEFSYARAAVHLGVREYLLKPLRIEDLRKALDHVSKSLVHRENALAENSIDVESLLREQLAEQLIRGGSDSESAALLMEHLHFPSVDRDYRVVLIQFYAESPDGGCVRKIAEIARRALQTLGLEVVDYPSDLQTVCAVVAGKNDVSFDQLSEALSQTTTAARDALNVQLKISVSNACSGISMVHNAYLEALAVQQYHLFRDDQKIAIHMPEKQFSGSSVLLSIEMRHHLMNLLRKGEPDSIRRFIEERFQKIHQTNAGADTVYICVAEMMSTILEFKADRGALSDETDSEDVLPALFSINHTDSLKKFILHYALEAVQSAEQDDTPHNSLIRRVQEYVNANYMNSSLRLEDIAKANFISTQYLCSIYRRAAHATVGDYIFETRMEQARRLISQGQRNVTAIAEACGYDDAGYFCKCFRRKFGMTPRQYIESQSV